MYFCHFNKISLLKRVRPIIWTLELPSPKDVLLYLVEILKENIFKNFVNVFSLLSLLGKGQGTSFKQTWILSTQECFVSSLVQISPVVLEQKKKMWKVYNNDNNNDNRQQTNCDQKAHLSLRLRWAKRFKSATQLHEG